MMENHKNIDGKYLKICEKFLIMLHLIFDARHLWMNPFFLWSDDQLKGISVKDNKQRFLNFFLFIFSLVKTLLRRAIILQKGLCFEIFLLKC